MGALNKVLNIVTIIPAAGLQILSGPLVTDSKTMVPQVCFM